MSGKVLIYNYDNYRRFLEDSYKAKKTLDAKFSFRYFAAAAGFSSSNYLKLVMQGQRNLTDDSAKKVARAFELNIEESKFFQSLVAFNQAKTADQRQFYAHQLLGSRKLKKMFPLRQTQYEYYAHWYNIVIRELVGTAGFKEDANWIAKKVVPQITPAQARKALDTLLTLQLIKHDDNGHLVQSEAHLATPDEVTSSSVAMFHKEMMKKASDALDLFPREKREFSSVALPMTKDTAKKVKELMQTFRKGIVEIASQESDANIVYYLNLQLFPLVNDEPEIE